MHAAVVLVPLAAIGTIAIAVWGAARRRIGWIVVVLGFAAFAFALLAQSSGEPLEEQVDETELAEEHGEAGENDAVVGPPHPDLRHRRHGPRPQADQGRRPTGGPARLDGPGRHRRVRRRGAGVGGGHRDGSPRSATRGPRPPGRTSAKAAKAASRARADESRPTRTTTATDRSSCPSLSGRAPGGVGRRRRGRRRGPPAGRRGRRRPGRASARWPGPGHSSPVPSGPCQNRSKARSRWSGVIPGPWSATWMAGPVGVATAASRMVEPSG